MKLIPNLNRQSILSILFGISLATFGMSVAVLICNMYEKEERKKYQIREYMYDLQISEKYVAAIIGKGGSVIKNIEELTGTRIKIEKKSDFPSDRFFLLRGDTPEKVYSAVTMILEILQNYMDIETFEFFMPFEASARVFSRNQYKFALEIQKSCGVKVICDTNAHKTATGLKGKITLKGKVDQIKSAIVQIIDKVEREVQVLACRQMQFSSKTPPEDPNDIIAQYWEYGFFKYFLPSETYKRIIKKDGCVEEIEKFTGARIIDDTPLKYEGEERKVLMIVGTTEKSVKLVYTLINGIEAYLESLECSEDTIKEISESSSCNNDSSTSNNILNPILQQDGLMDVYVSAMKSPSLFYIQVIGPANDDLQHLIEEMTEYYNNVKNREIHSLKKITEGQKVAAKFPYDGKWYRAEVMSIANSTMCQVVYVDFGDVEIISKDYMFELRTDMLSLRQQAVECSLANVEPQEETWNTKVTEKFAELVHLAKWKPLIAKVKGYKECPIDEEEPRRQSSLIPCIELYDKATNKNIGEELIQLGMAQTEKETCSAVNRAVS